VGMLPVTAEPRQGFAQLDQLLEADPQLDELAFVPGPLSPALFTNEDAALGFTSLGVGAVPQALLTAGHRLAIATQVLPQLHAEATAEWRAQRSNWRAAASRGERCRTATQLLRATRALLLLTLGQSYTAWNDRKRILLSHHSESPPTTSVLDKLPDSSADISDLRAELDLARLVIHSFPKAHEAWSHRRWVLRRLAHVAGDAALLPLAADEIQLCEGAQQLRRANYHAARHRAEVVRRLVEIGFRGLSVLRSVQVGHNGSGGADERGTVAAVSTVLTREADASRRTAMQIPFDVSVLYCRRQSIRAVAELAGQVPSTDDRLAEELAWVEAKLRLMPWNEARQCPCFACTPTRNTDSANAPPLTQMAQALWQHRRFLLCWRAGNADGVPHQDSCFCPLDDMELPPLSAAVMADLKPEQRESATRWCVLHTAWCTQPRATASATAK